MTVKTNKWSTGLSSTGLALAAFALLAVNPVASASTPTCQSPLSDPDGDGWGWENNQSCAVISVPNHEQWPACVYASSDSDGDGYGWENAQSCVVGTARAPAVSASRPTCEHADSDADGDGWGWEQGRSCIVSGNQEPPISPAIAAPSLERPVCASSASDPDGDGWGWENGQSCRVDGTQASGESGGAESGSGDSGTGADGSSSLPVCLSTASDPLDSGYGYEFGQSCKVVAGVSNTADDPLYNTEFCASWDELAYGDYRLQNNTWNARQVYSDKWSQCIELEQNSRGDTVAVWRFDWLGKYDGDQAQVKSYPQVYYGRKNQWNFSGTAEELGLPRPLDALDEFTVDYAFTTRGNAEYNVALESFFHTSCDADESNKQFEMMVWVGIPGEKTPGTQITHATIDGVDWKVYANPALSWGYVAFVAPQTTPSGRLDWNAFIDWSRANGPGLGLGTLENTCMGAIEIGTETFWGELEFRLDRFEVTRR